MERPIKMEEKKQSIARDGVGLTISQFITMLLQIITSMLLSRFRSLEEFGTFSQIISAIDLTYAFFSLGLPNSVNFFMGKAKNLGEKEKYVSVYFSFSTILMIINGLFLVFCAPILVNYYKNTLINSFIYSLAVLPWTIMVIQSIELFFVIYGKTPKLMFFRLANGILLLSLIVIVQLMNWNFKIYMILYSLLEIGISITSFFIVRRMVGKINFRFDSHLIKRILTYSIPISLSSFVGTISVEMNKLFIGRFYSVEDYAIYSNAAKELPIAIIASALSLVSMPVIISYVMKKDNEKAINLWKNSTIMAFIFICIISMGIFTFSREVISILYSSKYLPGVRVFQVYSLIPLLRCTYFGMILSSVGKTKLIFINALVSLLINVILIYPLFRLLGFYGPAVSTFISLFVLVLFQLLATSKAVKIRLSKIFPWIPIFLISIFCASLGLFFSWIKTIITLDLIFSEEIESIILGIIWCIIYFTALFPYIRKIWKSLSVSSESVN